MKKILFFFAILSIHLAQSQTNTSTTTTTTSSSTTTTTTSTTYSGSTEINPINPKWFFDANMGATWQQSDIKAYPGMAFGFTLGKYFYKKPGRWLNAAWRFRYLHGVMFGMDEKRSYGLNNNTSFNGNTPGLNYKDSLGYIFHNYRMEINRYALEGVIGFNRLRERTGIVLNLFGGIGLTQHWNKTDQLDESGNMYDYSRLDSLGTTYEALHDLRDFNSLRTLDFESNSDGYTGSKTVFMPSLGIELGYQFGNWFMLGFGHKVTFALNDEIDGYKWNNDNTPQGKNDRYHYSHVIFRWFIGRGNGSHASHNTHTNNNNTVNTNTNTNVNNPPPPPPPPPPTDNRPVVHFTTPASCPTNVTSQLYTVSANVYYVNQANQITFKVNGSVVTNFSYSASTHQFVSSPLTLVPGDNIIEIKAINHAGSDYQNCVVHYQTTINNLQPPVITVTNPPTNPYNTNVSTITVTGTILNVSNISQIGVQVNGVSTSAFYFNPSNGAFSSNVYLNPGVNTVNITATNTVGSDNEIVTINYQQPNSLQPPIVTIYNPTLNPYTVATNTANVNATVMNVNTAAGVNVKLNGVNYTGFAFNGTTHEVSLTAPLISGANLIEITGTNAAGTDSKSTTIIYQIPPSNLPPVVTYTDPIVNPYTSTTSTKLVKATVSNVSSASQVNVKLNGSPITGFSFVSSTGAVSFNATLISGANVVEIKGTNPYGSDAKTTVIVYNGTTTGLPPVIAINYPLSNPYNTSSISETVTATVLNITSSSAINVKVNGTPTSSFTFNGTTKLLTIPVSLVTGSNTVAITATNAYGSDNETQTLLYTPECLQPVITNVSPTTTSLTTVTSPLAFITHITNISSASQLSFKVNGATSTFSYDPTTGSFNSTVNLNNGSNTVVLTATNSCGTFTNTYNIVYLKPLNPPVITYINPAVNPSTATSATYNVKANITNMSSSTGIVFTVNGIPSTAFTYNATTDLFTATVSLISGNNTLEIKATNTDGTDVESTVIVYAPTPPPCNVPVIALSNPGGSVYSTGASVLNLLATITNCTPSQVAVSVNGVVVPSILTGTSLSADVTLNEGLNTVVINGTNDCGTTLQTIAVTYTRTPEPPVVTIVNPATNPYNASSASLTIQAKIYKVSSAANVTFTINGTSSTAFTFNPSTNDFTANYILTAETTTFVIKGTNADGTDSKSLVVKYEEATPACNNPVVTYTNTIPNNGTSTVAAFTLKADVDNIPASSGIVVKLNGNSIPFSFNTSTKKLTAAATLVSGLNEFIVTATNTCGSVSETYLINYTIPCVNPTIAALSASGSSTTVTTASYNLSVATTELTSSQITLTNNGVAVPFTLNASGVLNATVSLSPGSNNIVATGTNTCGSIIKNLNVVYNVPCPTPTIALGSGLATTASAASYTFTANTTNLTSSEITLTNNGSPIPFTLGASGTLTATLTLTEGSNNITIIGNSACGYATQNITVVYTVPCMSPDVTITAGLPTSVTATAYTLTANTSNLTATEIVVTNNGTVVPFTLSASGTLTANVTLSPTTNNLLIKGTNACGTVSKNITVTYTVPCVNPTVTLGTLPTTATAATYVLNATTTELMATEITVTLNGANVPFSLATGGALTATLTLTSGSNTIVVKGTNNCGTDSKSITVAYTPPCPVPVLSLGSGLSTAVTTASYSFNASSDNLTAGEIGLSNNGVNIPFTFASSGNITATISLTAGVNHLVLTGTNACGTVSKTIDVTYTIPCVSPTLTLSSGLSTNVTSASYSFAANSSELTASQISLTNNGSNIPFTLNASGNISASITLGVGANNIVITGTNTCGSVTQNITVTYTIPCVAPSIALSSGLATEVTTAAYSFTASSDELTSTQVTLLNNGITVPFTMNASGVVTASMTLVAGSNNIVITGTNACGTVSKEITVNYSAPCPNPVINLGVGLATSVTSASYSFSASSDALTASQITLKNNGTTIPFTLNASGGITATITLTTGSNAIVITGTNACGTVTKNITVTYNIPCTAPEISLTSGLSTTATTASYNFSATATDLTTSQISVTNNGLTIPFTMNASGLVSCTVSLSIGTNNIVITGTNACGTATQNHTVSYAPPCASPFININAGLPTYVTTAAYNFDATANELTASQITLKNNGTTIPFTLDASGALTANLTLTVGTNTIVITGTNSCGTVSKNISVVYELPCVSPTIVLDASMDEVVTSTAFTFNASTDNLTASQVSLKNNGTVVSFTMNASGNVTASTTLVEGANNFVIVGTNACGTVTKNITVTYTTPCTSPTINIGSGAAISTTSSTYTFMAGTTELTAAQITVKNNGTSVPFTLDASGDVAATITLTSGMNVIEITGTNPCGTLTKSKNVNYEPTVVSCPAPVLNSVTPTLDGATFTASSLTVSGSLSNVNTASEIVLKLNGTILTGVYFNPSTGAFTKTLTLVTGTNTILLDVTTDCGTIHKEYSCTYTTESTCGPRFNPGNSEWEFCLITPSGSYNRDDLASNPSFTYSGPATSVYFKPIAGGGDAIVNGSPLTLDNGKYYLFTGSLTVDVSNSHPGSMGHWSICITANAMPVFGNGSSRPDSPCETKKTDNNNNHNNNINNHKNTPNNDKTSTNDAEYNKAMATGNAALTNKNYIGAKAEFQKALSYKPGDGAAQEGVRKCNDALNKASEAERLEKERIEKEKAAKEAQERAIREAKEKADREAAEKANLEKQKEANYVKAISAANIAFMAKNYIGAKAEFQKALSYKPNDPTALAGIKKCNDALKPVNKDTAPKKEEAAPAPEKNTNPEQPKGETKPVIPGKIKLPK